VKTTKDFIIEQKKKVAETREALVLVNAASTAVTETNHCLAGPRDILRLGCPKNLAKHGHSQQVSFETLFPKPAETVAAHNLRQSLAATKIFCAEKGVDFEKYTPKLRCQET